MATIQAGDEVVLWADDRPQRIVRVESGTVRVPGLGVLRLGDLIGKPWGSEWKLGDQSYRLLRPTVVDRATLVVRGAQIVLPKDASRIVYECGLHAGSRVVEAGVGSGALTIALAHAVAPAGRVYAYDVREDHLLNGKKNVEAAGLGSCVEFRIGDVATSIQERDLDATVFDLPEPERCVEPAWEALRPSGVFAAYSPLVVQMERTAQALRAKGFVAVRALELLERPWIIHERGSRPDTNMLAHTGFLVFARRP